MSFLHRMAVLGIFLALAGRAYAQECNCNSVEGSTESIFEADTVHGKHLKLRFEVNPVTTATRLGFLCVDPQQAVSLAKLWMPDMGHGSSPTRLVPVGTGCTRVERMNYLMEGTWEVRVTLTDNDTGTLSFDVERAE